MLSSPYYASDHCLVHPHRSVRSLRYSRRRRRASFGTSVPGFFSNKLTFCMNLNSETPSAEPADNSFFSIVRETFVGTKRDFTQGSIVAALIVLAIPMILEMSMEAVFAIVDTFFVSKLGTQNRSRSSV